MGNKSVKEYSVTKRFADKHDIIMWPFGDLGIGDGTSLRGARKELKRLRKAQPESVFKIFEKDLATMTGCYLDE